MGCDGFEATSSSQGEEVMIDWVFVRTIVRFTWSDWLWTVAMLLTIRMLVIVFWLSVFMVYL